jgi:hypothetical protein
LAGAGLIVLGACTGEIEKLDSDPQSSPGNGGKPGQSGQALCTTDETSPGVTPLRRLTRSEYNNTVRDLLGDSTRPADEFADDPEVDGWSNDASVLGVTPQLADQYATAARELAEAAVASPAALVPCQLSAGDASCVESFVRSFGRRAFRRPLEPEEVSTYLALHQLGVDDSGFSTGVALVIEAMLQSPSFLFRVEIGTPPKDGARVVPLTSHERAARLSYFFWQTLPDAELDTLAEADALRTPEAVEEQARRLLADEERSAPAVLSFFSEWLELGHLEHATKTPELYPEFDPALQAAMKLETETFLRHVVFEADARLQTVLTAPYSFVNEPLAALYGIAGPNGDAFEQVTLDHAQRSGILTQASFLAGHATVNTSSPILRGKAVLTRLLCHEIPAPPPGVAAEPPELEPGASTRERFAAHTSDPACASCHQLMDPIGFSFEHYDAIGRWRTHDGDDPVDATGALTGLGDGDVEVDGAVELAKALASADESMRCAPRQAFRWAFGRVLQDADACTRDALEARFSETGGDLRELMIAITQTDAFLYKTIAE